MKGITEDMRFPFLLCFPCLKLGKDLCVRPGGPLRLVFSPSVQASRQTISHQHGKCLNYSAFSGGEWLDCVSPCELLGECIHLKATEERIMSITVVLPIWLLSGCERFVNCVGCNSCTCLSVEFEIRRPPPPHPHPRTPHTFAVVVFWLNCKMNLIVF